MKKTLFKTEFSFNCLVRVLNMGLYLAVQMKNEFSFLKTYLFTEDESKSSKPSIKSLIHAIF